MYPTNTVVTLAEISQYLADNDIAMNIEQDKLLGVKLYVERKSLEWMNNQLSQELEDEGFMLINDTDELMINTTDKFIL